VTASPADEPVEVVDEQGRVLEVVTRRRMRAENLRHRAVFVAVLSSDGRLLVHRRSDTKDVWPGWWDVAVGGVVGAGEADDDAAVRELAEEVGVRGVRPEPLGGGRYEDESVRIVGRCYRVVHDGPYTFVDGEVVEARLVDRDELRAMLATVDVLPDSVALMARLLPELF
jgi:isopentenyldiphosphate isomerase